MQTLQKFTGINNVLEPQELAATELTMASNVDIDAAGRARRRGGFSQLNAAKHANLWEAPGYTVATRGVAGDLVNVDSGAVLAAALGHSPRVWFAPLPGGRTAYSNGTGMGIVSADGSAAAAWGIPLPAGVGVATDTAGSLFPGDYRYAVTHQRLADGLEGGPAYAGGVVTVASGGVAFTGLPVLAGHRVNVYLTSHNGGDRWFAGSTTGSTFTFAGANNQLVRPCRTEKMLAPPPGAKILAFWRGRMLCAVGNALFASRLHSWHLFDLRKDFKQFSATITLVHPTDGGVWVGTEKELVFLAGDTWDALQHSVKGQGPVVLGSGAAVPGEYLTLGAAGRARGNCMVCIAGGSLVAGTPDGALTPLSAERYRTDAVEVSATFRLVDGTPQYVAQVLA